MTPNDSAAHGHAGSQQPYAEEPPDPRHRGGGSNATGVPVAVVFLMLMAYGNLWIGDLVPGYDWFDQTLPRLLLILLTLAYLLVIWIAGPNPQGAWMQRARLWRSAIALSLIVLIVLIPTAQFIRDRLASGPYPRNVIDWPLQIEAGARLLLSGHSPYAADYSGTDMRLWSERANFPTNPAMHHAIHLPVNFLLGAITLPIWQSLAGWYDARIILIAAYLAVLLLAPRLGQGWEQGHALQIGLALNPILVASFVVGLSDYLLVACVVALLWLRQRNRPRAAAAVLGVALATRQFSWLLAPIYLAAEWYALPQPGLPERLRALVWRLWPIPAIALLLIGPFFLVNPAGFYTDVILYGSGGIADAFPIAAQGSFGISAVVLAMGWASSQTAQFPFFLLQLIVAAPLMGLAIWKQRGQNTLRQMLLSYLIVLGAFMFMGRFLNLNYVGYWFAMMLLAYGVAETSLAQESGVRSQESEASN